MGAFFFPNSSTLFFLPKENSVIISSLTSCCVLCYLYKFKKPIYINSKNQANKIKQSRNTEAQKLLKTN